MTTPLLLGYPSPNMLVPEPPLCLQLLAATCMKMPKTPCQEVEFPSLDSSNGPKVVHARIFLVVEIKVEILLHHPQPLDLPMAALLDNARVNGDTVVLDLNIVVMVAKPDLALMVADLLLPLHHHLLLHHLETTTVEVAKFVLPQTLPKIQQLTGHNTVVKPKGAKTSVILELPLVFGKITAVKETALPLEAYLVVPLLELLLDAFVAHFLLLALSPLPS